MDLTDLTRDNLDHRLRVEFGVDVLAGRWPATRMVVFDRGPAVLAVIARRRREGEDWLGPIIELVYLARVLRPRGVALALPDRSSAAQSAFCDLAAPLADLSPDPSKDAAVDDGQPETALRVLLAERSLRGARVLHREHPVQRTAEGMPVWSPVRFPDLGTSPRYLMQLSLRRPSGSRPRSLAMVVRLLVEDGHRVIAVPWLADRLAGSGVLSAAPS